MDAEGGCADAFGVEGAGREQGRLSGEKRKRERREGLDEKVFHGKFFLETKEVADARSWQWVSGGYMAVGTVRLVYLCCAGAGAGEEVGKEYQVYGGGGSDM